MAKGISTVYGQGSLFRSRAIWSPDPTLRKNKKRKKKSAEPGVISARQQFKNRLRLGGQLREALGILKRQQRALEIATERLRRAGIDNERLQLENEVTDLKIAISVSEAKVAELRATLKAGTTNLRAQQEPLQRSNNQPSLPAGPPDIPLQLSLQELGVPVPEERTRPVGISYFTRDGQAEFRSKMLDLHGKCLLTGCIDAAALEAAHIIPYVDARSNVTRNGLCMRADIHSLYDRNLITINSDYRIEVAACVRSPEYRALHGKVLLLNCNEVDMPCRYLLSVRHLLIEFEVSSLER